MEQLSLTNSAPFLKWSPIFTAIVSILAAISPDRTVCESEIRRARTLFAESGNAGVSADKGKDARKKNNNAKNVITEKRVVFIA